jgi:hypothetical protein
MGTCTVVDIVTRYEMDGSRFESWSSRELYFFLVFVQAVREAHLISYKIGISFPSVKRPRHGLDSLRPSSAETEHKLIPLLHVYVIHCMVGVDIYFC